MAGQNDNTVSNEPSVGVQPMDLVAVQFDEQTVMSRGQAQANGEQIGDDGRSYFPCWVALTNPYLGDSQDACSKLVWA